MLEARILQKEQEDIKRAAEEAEAALLKKEEKIDLVEEEPEELLVAQVKKSVKVSVAKGSR